MNIMDREMEDTKSPNGTSREENIWYNTLDRINRSLALA